MTRYWTEILLLLVRNIYNYGLARGQRALGQKKSHNEGQYPVLCSTTTRAMSEFSNLHPKALIFAVFVMSGVISVTWTRL